MKREIEQFGTEHEGIVAEMDQAVPEMWTWKNLGTQIGGLRKSRAFRGSASNATYGLLEYIAQPALIVLSAPYLVPRLGLDQYGIWMLVNAFTGTVGIFHVGLGDATIKYVSGYKGRGDSGGVQRIISATLALSAILGAASALCLVLIAPFLVHHVFKIAANRNIEAIHAIQAGSLVLWIQSLYQVFANALKAYEVFGPPTKIAVAVKAGTVAAAVILVALGYGIVPILLATAGVNFVGTIVQAIVTQQIIGGRCFYPVVDRSTWREVLGFGCYSWIQNAAGVAFSQADRFLVAAMLGTVPLAYYTLCLQLAQQIHGVVGAAFGFLFPHVSAKYESGNKKGVRRVFRWAVTINIALSIAFMIPLVFLGRKILSIWMGRAFAADSYLVLAILAVAFCALSINVAPHFTLLGLGKVRFVSITNVIGGALSLIGAAVLIPSLGLIGAAAGRLFYGPIISMNFVKVAKSL
jgi:O-antigen/teichoic acid export membrane protein